MFKIDWEVGGWGKREGGIGELKILILKIGDLIYMFKNVWNTKSGETHFISNFKDNY